MADRGAPAIRPNVAGLSRNVEISWIPTPSGWRYQSKAVGRNEKAKDACTLRTRSGMLLCMSVPVTARLDESVVEALDRAVEAGVAPSRGAAVARAVAEWLTRHGEDAIIESYRRRYAEPNQAHDDLIEKLAAFSLAACLADSER
jgi:Arc/MetJ-type ribon-helix-helix transcriptional regulator